MRKISLSGGAFPRSSTLTKALGDRIQPQAYWLHTTDIEVDHYVGGTDQLSLRVPFIELDLREERSFPKKVHYVQGMSFLSVGPEFTILRLASLSRELSLDRARRRKHFEDSFPVFSPRRTTAQSALSTLFSLSPCWNYFFVFNGKKRGLTPFRYYVQWVSQEWNKINYWVSSYRSWPLGLPFQYGSEPGLPYYYIAIRTRSLQPRGWRSFYFSNNKKKKSKKKKKKSYSRQVIPSPLFIDCGWNYLISRTRLGLDWRTEGARVEDRISVLGILLRERRKGLEAWLIGAKALRMSEPDSSILLSVIFPLW